VDFGKNAAGEPILTLTNLEGDIYCASQGARRPSAFNSIYKVAVSHVCSPAEAQHLATYKVTVRYMLENPTTSAHTQHVRFYSTLLSRRIDSGSLFAIPAPPPAPPPAAPVGMLQWAWEEATHALFKVGQQVEVTAAFKPKFQDYVGAVAVIRKIFAKKRGADLYKEYTFFVEVQGRDAGETERFRSEVAKHNHKSFNFLRGDARSLLPCRQIHMRFFSQARCDIANSNAAAKRPRLEQQDAPPAQSDIKLGDSVEILKTLYIMQEFVGFHGVVRRIEKRESFTSCWVEIQCNHAGQAVDLAAVVRKKNRSFYTEQEMWLSWVCCRADNVVLAGPHIPAPWTPESWAALPVKDRKMHRHTQQQDKEHAVKPGGGAPGSDATPGVLPQPGIRTGDCVEILHGLRQYIGHYGVVRKIRQDDDVLACFVEVQWNPAGHTLTQDEVFAIMCANRGFDFNRGEDLKWLCCNAFNVAVADHRPPPPWTVEAWSRLPFKDRKMHRLKQRDALDGQGGKTSSKRHADSLAADSQDIAVGDAVEIRQIICTDWYPERFVGFRGVVRSIQENSLPVTCFVELSHTRAGAPVTPEHTKTIEDWNKGMYGPDERSFMKCSMHYIVRAAPKLPSDGAPPPTSKRHRDRPRHSKYDPTARAPWRGGEVRPFLYGRKITFILNGKRGDPIAR